MVDGTRAGLPLQEEPEDSQPAPALHPVDDAAARGHHAAAPVPPHDELTHSLSFAPEPEPEPDPEPVLEPGPVLVATAPAPPELVVVPEPAVVPEVLPEALPEQAAEVEPTDFLSASRPENWASYRPLAEPEKDAAAPPIVRVPKVELPKVEMPRISLPKVAVPKVHAPKLHAPQLRKHASEKSPAKSREPELETAAETAVEIEAVAPAHAAPPGDLPGYVEYRPSRLPRFVFALLFVGTAIGAVLSILAAINDGSHWAIGMAACVAALSLGFWWGLIAWSPTVVSISDGILKVTEGSNTEAVDLKNPAIDVVIGHNPRSRSWRTVVTRPDESQLVVRRREVDAEEFTALATHWREVADRERQSIHDRRNR